MNSIKFFSILAAVLTILALGWLGTQNTPQWAALFAALALIASGRVLILFEDEQPPF